MNLVRYKITENIVLEQISYFNLVCENDKDMAIKINIVHRIFSTFSGT